MISLLFDFVLFGFDEFNNDEMWPLNKKTHLLKLKILPDCPSSKEKVDKKIVNKENCR